MEKGPHLPIKFYPAEAWQDYQKIKNYSDDVVFVKEHNLFPPAFQMGMPDEGRVWNVTDFTLGTFELVDADDGTTYDLWLYDRKDTIVYNKAGDFRNWVWWRFPAHTAANAVIPEGRYYYHVIDQYGESSWFSEVFELCDLGTSAISAAFTDGGGFAATNLDWNASNTRAIIDFCKTGAAEAQVYHAIDTFVGEEFDLYVVGSNYGPACGAADWNDPVYFELRTTDGVKVSNTLSMSAVGELTGMLKSEAGGTVRLVVYVLPADTTAVDLRVFFHRRYAENHVQIRYSNPENFCKIFYRDEDDELIDYENVFFIDAKQVIDQNPINENVVEDDEANKYRIVGTNQKWNSVKFVSGEAMLNAMSLLRLHETIKIIRETGEPMEVAELLIEQSVVDYEAADIKLVYREASCSVESCGFPVCCPTPELPAMLMAADIAAFPASADGVFALAGVGVAQFLMYKRVAAAWALNTDYNATGNCVEAAENWYLGRGLRGNRFFWWDAGGARWRPFIYLTSVTDNADGTGTLNVDNSYQTGTVRGEYQDALGDWNECTAPEDIIAGGGAVTLDTLTGNPGVGTWNFRVHHYDGDCDYGYSEVRSQTIT